MNDPFFLDNIPFFKELIEMPPLPRSELIVDWELFEARHRAYWAHHSPVIDSATIWKGLQADKINALPDHVKASLGYHRPFFEAITPLRILCNVPIRYKHVTYVSWRQLWAFAERVNFNWDSYFHDEFRLIERPAFEYLIAWGIETF